MKILITHELFPPDFAGGGEKIMYELAKRLLEKGHPVRVLTTGNPKIKEYKGIKTKRLKLHRYFMNLAVFHILRQARQAEIIHTSSYNAFFPSWLVGKIIKKPVVCYVMGFYGKRWLKMRGPIFGTFSRVAEKIMLKRSYDKIVFLSDYSKEWAKEIGIDKTAEVVNPGIEIKEYLPGKKEEFVLFVGRFAKQKGIDDILKVAKRLPNLKFVMIGWGEEEERIKRIAPPNIIFHDGFNNKKKVLELYAKAPVCFFPSVGETFGLVVLEAMASGCAIVSTIDLDYEGFKIKPHQIDKMAEKIDYLMKNKKEREIMGRKNIEIAKNYSWERFTEKFIEIYQETMNKKS